MLERAQDSSQPVSRGKTSACITRSQLEARTRSWFSAFRFTQHLRRGRRSSKIVRYKAFHAREGRLEHFLTSNNRGPSMAGSLSCPLPPQFRDMERDGELQLSARKVPRWYAVFTMARHEKQIAWHLGQREIESFLPLYKTKRRWKNRCTVALELPLFPNYVFVRIDLQERLRVLKIPSVVSIVSVGREPLPVEDHYITGLRAGLLTHEIEPHPGLDVGDWVRITNGAMADMVGVLDRQKNAFRVVLSLEMIGRSVAVEVDVASIEPTDAPKRNARARSLQLES